MKGVTALHVFARMPPIVEHPHFQFASLDVVRAISLA